MERGGWGAEWVGSSLRPIGLLDEGKLGAMWWVRLSYCVIHHPRMVLGRPGCWTIWDDFAADDAFGSKMLTELTGSMLAGVLSMSEQFSCGASSGSATSHRGPGHL